MNPYASVDGNTALGSPVCSDPDLNQQRHNCLVVNLDGQFSGVWIQLSLGEGS